MCWYPIAHRCRWMSAHAAIIAAPITIPPTVASRVTGGRERGTGRSSSLTAAGLLVAAVAVIGSSVVVGVVVAAVVLRDGARRRGRRGRCRGRGRAAGGQLLPGGGEHVPAGAEGLKPLATGAAGRAVVGEQVHRVAGVGELGRAVGPHALPDQGLRHAGADLG